MKNTKQAAVKKTRATRAEKFTAALEQFRADIKDRGKLSADSIEILRDLIISGICTNHDGKMRGIWSLSTSCTVNPYCLARMQNGDCVCAKCYADTLAKQRAGLRIKNECNAKLFTEIVIPAAAMPFINAAIFRLESFGDLINETQLINYFTLCNANKRTRFVLWTKNWFIVRRVLENYSKPENLTIIASSPFLNVPAKSLLDKYTFIDKIFTVYSLKHLQAENVNPDKFINCGGRSCINCRRCYKTRTGAVVNEMLKSDAAKWENMKHCAR